MAEENEEKIREELRKSMPYMYTSGCNARDVFYNCARSLVDNVSDGKISLKDYMKLFDDEISRQVGGY